MTRPPNSSHVLVIDDEHYVRLVTADLLASLGVSACLSTGGRDGVTRYASHAARAEPFALVLLDVQMSGFDGPATLAALRAADPDVRCCFMSGGTGPYTRADLRRLGADWFLPKPFRRRDLAIVLAAAGCLPAAAGTGLDVLVMDADVDAAGSLADVLRYHGHTVATAGTAAAGLQAAAGRPPDAVVYDLNLPDLDGAGVSNRLRARDRRPLLAAVGCTAGPRAADGEADVYLLKPVEPDVVSRLLGRFAGLLGSVVA